MFGRMCGRSDTTNYCSDRSVLPVNIHRVVQFHLGKPILVMLVIALISGIGLMFRTSPPRAQITLWTFADSHARMYRGAPGEPRDQTMAGKFEQLSGKTVEIKLINGSALNLRITAMFDRPVVDPNQPDIAEIEIGSIGRYFRPPVDEVGFTPLNEMLEKSGWRSRILEARLAPWTKEGGVFGLPHDVHPVSISYRKDLFDEAGVDLAASKTWYEFQDNCLKFETYWRSRGYPLRHAMELPTAAADYLVVMLLQRGINALDDRNQIHLTDKNVAETIAFYAQMVAGPRAVATDATPGGNLWARDFAQGDLCAVVTPDWRAGYLRRYASQEIAGKVAMMALPKFDERDAPTGSWGGTMAGIPKRCPDPQGAFDLIMHLYSSKEGVIARWRDTMILPSVKELWDEPVFHEPDPYYGGQRTGELYVQLAREMPLRYVTPFTAVANAQLSNLLARSVQRVREGVTGDALVAEIRVWLVEASADLQRRIDFGKFEDDGARE